MICMYDAFFTLLTTNSIHSFNPLSYQLFYQLLLCLRVYQVSKNEVFIWYRNEMLFVVFCLIRSSLLVHSLQPTIQRWIQRYPQLYLQVYHPHWVLVSNIWNVVHRECLFLYLFATTNSTLWHVHTKQSSLVSKYDARSIINTKPTAVYTAFPDPV